LNTFSKTTIAALFAVALGARAGQHFVDEHFDVLKAGGDTYSNVTVTTVTATDIYFTYSRGMGNAKIWTLAPELRSHFSYDATAAAQAKKAQTLADSQYREQLKTAPAARPQVDTSREPEPNAPEGLEAGQKFPGFNVTDSSGGNLSPENFKGKVVLIDFWATWCGPCRGELPNVIALYQTYHPQGFEIIGVSLDDDKNTMLSFTQKMGMGWQQYFDGKGWNNDLAKKYGIHSIPMTFLLDRNGVIIGTGLRGENLSAALEKAFAGQ
jgi:thiol-disulfide isomerase/thioredoxin